MAHLLLDKYIDTGEQCMMALVYKNNTSNLKYINEKGHRGLIEHTEILVEVFAML